MEKKRLKVRRVVSLPAEVVEKGLELAEKRGMNFSAYVGFCMMEYWSGQERSAQLAERIGEKMADRTEMDTKALELLQRMMTEMERFEPKR